MPQQANSKPNHSRNMSGNSQSMMNIPSQNFNQPEPTGYPCKTESKHDNKNLRHGQSTNNSQATARTHRIMQGINLNEYIALNESHINYSPSAQTKDFAYKRLSANKQSSINEPNSSLNM